MDTKQDRREILMVTFRNSYPSSTLCLNGPRSTSRMSSGLTLVSPYSASMFELDVRRNERRLAVRRVVKCVQRRFATRNVAVFQARQQRWHQRRQLLVDRMRSFDSGALERSHCRCAHRCLVAAQQTLQFWHHRIGATS